MTKLDLSTLQVITALTSSIQHYDLNPREHSPEQVGIIGASIGRYGFVNPLLVTPDFTLIAGHGRHQAAVQLGLKEVPVIVLPHLSEAEQRAYRIADNATSLKGKWSVANLAIEVEFLFKTDFDLGFDAIDLGMNQGDMDAVLGAPSVPQRVEREPQPDHSQPPVSRIGDLWTIDVHRYLCGDSTDEASYLALLGEERADLVFNDPPYNVKVNGHIGGKGKVKHPEFVQGSGEMSREEFQTFIRKTFELAARFSRGGAINFQFCDWRIVADMITIGETIYDSLRNICVWVKPSPAMGSLYRSRHEFVLVFRTAGGKHVNNVQLGRMGRNRSNVWEYASPASFGSERAKLKLHPTCKNLQLLSDAIMDVTNHKDIVLDAFLGSGSTGLACDKVGRRCRGIELDPRYVDLAVQRIAEATGATPTLADGMTFGEARAMRSGEVR